MQISPMRALVAAILQQAVDDCLGREVDPSEAYLWVMNSKDCEAYCGWLDIDYGRFRESVVRLAGERCERALRRRRHGQEAECCTEAT